MELQQTNVSVDIPEIRNEENFEEENWRRGLNRLMEEFGDG